MKPLAVLNAILTREIGSPPITRGNNYKRQDKASESMERQVYCELYYLAPAL